MLLIHQTNSLRLINGPGETASPPQLAHLRQSVLSSRHCISVFKTCQVLQAHVHE